MKRNLKHKSDDSIHKQAYDTLADEYESRVGSLIPMTVEAIEICATYLQPGNSVLDIGCAVGIAVKCFNDKGFLCTGVELSHEMTTYAKTRNPMSDIIEADFLQHEFQETFDSVYMSAFIHLFPKDKIQEVFKKVKKILKPNGLIFLSTTKAEVSREGLETKHDYNKRMIRFRKHRTEQELQETLENHGFEIINKRIFADPYNKTWMGFVARKID